MSYFFDTVTTSTWSNSGGFTPSTTDAFNNMQSRRVWVTRVADAETLRRMKQHPWFGRHDRRPDLPPRKHEGVSCRPVRVLAMASHAERTRFKRKQFLQALRRDAEGCQ